MVNLLYQQKVPFDSYFNIFLFSFPKWHFLTHNIIPNFIQFYLFLQCSRLNSHGHAMMRVTPSVIRTSFVSFIYTMRLVTVMDTNILLGRESQIYEKYRSLTTTIQTRLHLAEIYVFFVKFYVDSKWKLVNYFHIPWTFSGENSIFQNPSFSIYSLTGLNLKTKYWWKLVK